MSKYTPGPWVDSPTGTIHARIPFQGHGHLIAIGTALENEVEAFEFVDKDAMRANGKLMAAAPELLEILDEMSAEAEELTWADNSDQRRWDRMINKAKQVLKKARGEK